MNEDKENLIREIDKANLLHLSEVIGEDDKLWILKDEIVEWILNKLSQSNKALLTKLRGEMKIGRKEYCTPDKEINRLNHLAIDIHNEAKDQDIALIDKYLEQ